ncbi:MAG: efflux RND transporter permease subunit [Acidobacteriaceae bacterium]|nr:efflux RND transporter permease subunit [Acidobacteriaceae bacterium]MBV9501844.1 efflux RND transporter permease subunit [Acidobacteriaceae bacterium]
MSIFSIRNPYFIVALCLALCLIGVASIVRMPVDLFPTINIPTVVVATFYSGMPPADIETDITNPLERFFTMAAGVDHMESRSMLGVSLIKVIFQPGSNADTDVTELSNLALADLKRLPPGTLPPVVLKFDASSQPVCLVTVKGKGLTETQLHDFAQFTIRNQIAVVKGATIPPPFGGKYRQVMVYVDPYKLMSRQLSPMDVVSAINRSNLILPAGDVKLGPYDYYVYSNSLVDNMTELNDIPIKTVGDSWVSVKDVGKAQDASAIQYNIVRVDGQKSTYIPIMKQGGDTNTIEVVNGVRQLLTSLYDIPKQLVTNVVFDQSVFVKEAIKTVLHEGLIGLALTSLMILVFLGSPRATTAVLLSIPISALATFIILDLLGATVNTLILGGLALAFSRVIDNSVISLENIYRHLELGEPPMMAAEAGGSEVTLAVLAATLVGVVAFFPVTTLAGVSKFLFSALALSFCLSLFISFAVAMTVIPLFCSRFLKGILHGGHAVEPPEYGGEEGLEHVAKRSLWTRFNEGFNSGFNRVLNLYESWVRRSLRRPGLTVIALTGVFVLSLAIYPFLGVAFFPRTDAGQFTINMKAPTGSRIELTNEYVAKVEDLIRQTVGSDLKMVVSNIGIVPDFSALYTSNAGPYTATVQAALDDDHKVSTFEYMDRVQNAIAEQFPEIRTFVQTGSMVDATLNAGMPAPIDVQVTSRNMRQNYQLAQELGNRVRKLRGVGEIYIPQDVNYPAVRMEIDRVHAGELGLSEKDVVDNVITALNSNAMIAPNYWVDYETGNDYFLTVQYYEHGKPAIHNFLDLTNIPLKAPNLKEPTTLDTVVKLEHTETPTEIDHYQIQRAADVYVTPKGEDLGRVASAIDNIVTSMKVPGNVRVNLRGMVQGMNQSFKSFAQGFILAAMLLYLVLVAQFRSFIDPFLIMLAIPMGFIGVLIILPLTGTTLNVMSLMGVLMLIGVAGSNSILIVDFAHKLEEQNFSVTDAVIAACRVRLRPILMTSLATIIGMLPMALKLGTGSEQYAPMARAIIGGLTSSVILTVFIVPAAYLLVYGKKDRRGTEDAEEARA